MLLKSQTVQLNVRESYW